MPSRHTLCFATLYCNIVYRMLSFPISISFIQCICRIYWISPFLRNLVFLWSMSSVGTTDMSDILFCFMFLNKHRSAIFSITSASRGFSKNWAILATEPFRSCNTQIHTSPHVTAIILTIWLCIPAVKELFAWNNTKSHHDHLFIADVQYVFLILSIQPTLHMIKPWAKYH